MYIYTPRYVQFKKNYNIICNIVYNVHVCVCVCGGLCPVCVSRSGTYKSYQSYLAYLLYVCCLALSCLILPYLVLACLILSFLRYLILSNPIYPQYLPACLLFCRTGCLSAYLG